MEGSAVLPQKPIFETQCVNREARSKIECKTCGIPHLAKNERDVGHPAIVAGIEPYGWAEAGVFFGVAR